MAKKKIPILNEEQTRVNLFLDTIKLDQDLPKYKIMAEKKGELTKEEIKSFSKYIRNKRLVSDSVINAVYKANKKYM